MKKKVVISAINLFEGGTLSVLKDCLHSIENSNQFENFEFIALVHKKELFDTKFYNKVSFFEFPKSRKSYFFRLFYEYIYFKKFVKKNKIDFWFSLHDITPNVGNIPQVVYCHNPSPFNKIAFKDLFIQPTIFFFSLFYGNLYNFNIKKNKYVVVQQLWIKEAFNKKFRVESNKIIIAKPQEPTMVLSEKLINSNEKLFIFPTFPRSFKNIEIIGEAVKILNKEKIENFSVSITIDGSENKYSKFIYDQYSKFKNINFIGLQSREKICELYSESSCLIFPSKLETWGLPISEYKQFNKPMIVADLPYAKETVGEYDKVMFFNHMNAKDLSLCMREIIASDNVKFDKTKALEYPQPYVKNWEELIELILN